MQVDPTGKISLEHIYTQPDPRAYFTTLRELDYRIPGSAKPYFAGLIEEYRRSQGVRTPQVLDIGCSYGINAVLSKCDATMEELYDRYGGTGSAAHDHRTLVARDRQFLQSRQRPDHARFVGLDASENALEYARAAGFIDEAVYADLESADPTDEQRIRLAGTDLVISTGCLGYVTEKTIVRVVDAQRGRRPWMAHFVLRMFPFDPIAESLADAGYETVHSERVFRQRRFATTQEQSLVLDNLSTIGVDPQGLETDGWFYARLYISRPRDTPGRAIIDLSTGEEPARTAMTTHRED